MATGNPNSERTHHLHFNLMEAVYYAWIIYSFVQRSLLSLFLPGENILYLRLIKRAKAYQTSHARNELTAHQKPSCSPIKFLINHLVNIIQEPRPSPPSGGKT